jgi:hypothetical protein
MVLNSVTSLVNLKKKGYALPYVTTLQRAYSALPEDSVTNSKTCRSNR